MESQTSRPPASESTFDRRTLLRAGAWSVPVIATVVATPVAAATTVSTSDLSVEGNGGSLQLGFNADRSRYFEQSITSLGRFFTVGEEATPSGSVLRVEWDSRRIPGDVELLIDESPVAVSGSGSVGTHGAYATFIIDRPIPAGVPLGQTGLSWTVRFGEADEDFYPEDEDLHPYAVLLTPPVGYEDPDMGNNGWTEQASYGDAWDAAVTDSTWSTVQVERTGEFPYTENVRIVEGMTIANQGTGVAPADTTGLYVWVPSALGNGSNVTDLRASLNGVNAPDAVAALTVQSDESQNIYESRILVDMQPGDVIELAWDVDLPSSHPDGEYLGASTAGIMPGFGDSDTTNHQAVDPES